MDIVPLKTWHLPREKMSPREGKESLVDEEEKFADDIQWDQMDWDLFDQENNIAFIQHQHSSLQAKQANRGESKHLDRPRQCELCSCLQGTSASSSKTC